MTSRFQFRTANLLWATTWTAIGLGAFAFGLQLFDKTSPVADYPDVILMFAGLGCYIAITLSPFAAIGALFGNIRRSLKIGGALSLILFVILLFLPTIKAN